jgi:GT2 family glycosyltransferase
MTTTVIVPSYQRPDDLRACLDALFRGSRTPDQVVVILREYDRVSHEALAEWRRRAGDPARRVELAEVSEPGQVAATNAGLALATGDVVCFTDDDCRPTADWLRSLLSHYQDPSVVGVGGRDIVHHGEVIEARPARLVGRLTWYGRIIGNHHQPAGDEPREVSLLKGANMSFRRGVILGFDRNIRGAHFSDTDASLSARVSGGKLIYDPLAAVHHYPAPRTGGFSRAATSVAEAFSDAHDWAYVMCKHLSPVGRCGFLVFALAVGQAGRLGLLRLLAALPRGPLAVVRRWRASLFGIIAGVRAARRARCQQAGPASSKRHEGPRAPCADTCSHGVSSRRS